MKIYTMSGKLMKATNSIEVSVVRAIDFEAGQEAIYIDGFLMTSAPRIDLDTLVVGLIGKEIRYYEIVQADISKSQNAFPVWLQDLFEAGQEGGA
jgi:hypothetical protein